MKSTIFDQVFFMASQLVCACS